MAYRFYNTNAVASSSSSALPNGFVRVNTFDSYKTLRERELALHRLACEVFSMHNAQATVTANPTNGEAAAIPAPAPLGRAQQRFLEDLRDLCSIPAETTEVELLAAATNPTVQSVAATRVAANRAMFYDGVDDVPLEAPVYAQMSNVGQCADDGGRLAVAITTAAAGGGIASSSSSHTAAAAHHHHRPASPQPSAAANGANGGAVAAVVDPTRIYMNDLLAIEKDIKALVKEVLSEATTEARRAVVNATLQEKRTILVNLKTTLSGGI